MNDRDPVSAFIASCFVAFGLYMTFAYHPVLGVMGIAVGIVIFIVCRVTTKTQEWGATGPTQGLVVKGLGKIIGVAAMLGIIAVAGYIVQALAR